MKRTQKDRPKGSFWKFFWAFLGEWLSIFLLRLVRKGTIAIKTCVRGFKIKSIERQKQLGMDSLILKTLQTAFQKLKNISNYFSEKCSQQDEHLKMLTVPLGKDVLQFKIGSKEIRKMGILFHLGLLIGKLLKSWHASLVSRRQSLLSFQVEVLGTFLKLLGKKIVFFQLLLSKYFPRTKLLSRECK